MPTPVLSSLSYNSTGTIATVSDSTTYTSPARNELAVFIEVWKMDEDGDETALSVSNSAPLTVTSWTFDSSIDGWYKARLYITVLYDSGTSYSEGDVVYYPSTQALYISLVDNNLGNAVTNGSFWSTVSLSNITSSDNVDSEYFDYIVIEQGKACAGKSAGDWARSTDCGSCNKIDLASKVLRTRAYVLAAQRFESISQYSKGEQIARELENFCESC